jgi:hypothetical protein
MFEKYKELKKKRDHFGMSKREYYKFMFMILIMVVCVVAIFMVWPRPDSHEGTQVDIPVTGDARIELPREQGIKAGSKEAKDKFDELRDKLIQQRQDSEGDTGELKLPEIPKPPSPWEPDEEIWKQVDDAAMDQVEEQVILYALHQLNSMTQEEILKKVAEDGSIPPSDFMEHPADYRGKFVSITGTLMSLENRILAPNRSGLNQYWYGLLYNQRQNPYRKFYFYIFDKDQEWLTQEEARSRDLSRNGDLVTVNGIFIKLYRNRTEGGAILTYPFIVARKLERARGITMRGQWQYSWVMLTVMGAVLGGVFIFFFIAMRRDRREGEKFLHSRKYKKAGLVKNEVARKVAAKAKSKSSQPEAGSEAGLDNKPPPETPQDANPDNPADKPGGSKPSDSQGTSP